MGGQSSTLKLDNSNKFFKRNIKVDYEIKGHIAIGEFSIIYDAESRDFKYQRAIQEISRSKMTEEDYKQLSETIKVLQNVQCPNIVKLYEVFEMPYSYYLVYEKINPETLMEKILKNKEEAENSHFPSVLFKAEEIKYFMKQILYALSICHSHNIIHKDIRPENFLVDGDELTLIDFRLAQIVEEIPRFRTRQSMRYIRSPINEEIFRAQDSLVEEDNYRMVRSGSNYKPVEINEARKSNIIPLNIGRMNQREIKNTKTHKKFGQFHYRAPETFKKEYYYQSDIWSAGIIFYILCTGNLPPSDLQLNTKHFSKMQSSESQYYADTPRFKNPFIPKKKFDTNSDDIYFVNEISSQILSDEGKDLMKQMLNQAYDRRISALTAMRHDYFKKDKIPEDFNFEQKKKTIINCVNNSQKNFTNVMLKKLVNLGIAKCEEEEKIASKEFKSLDDNCSGVLDNDIIRRMSINTDEEEIKLDEKQDLHIEYQDYIVNSIDWGTVDLKGMITLYFKKLGKSVLTKDEIRNEFIEVGDDEMDNFIKKADTDGDSHFSQEELCDYLIKEITQVEEEIEI
ncbi:hypothetical protein SteCoe_12590 [Stentor coeruleus]|uniref:Protein kinase domain-containing protein n=1 Tax=Stentor coeruleus TaxID=5963 RepID=A0A1R2CAC1_9CILI|nr:hypothetical protein SteCoe_12590 [Stentor coeruleus]